MASRGLCRAHKGLAKRGRWIPGVGPRFLPETLAIPLRRQKPTGYAVCLMGDLFHPGVPDEQIAAVFGGMAATPQHRYYILTKRAERMARWFAWVAAQKITLPLGTVTFAALDILGDSEPRLGGPVETTWPLPNVWLGVSVENQATADERIPHLLRCPAAVRWVSMEPLLEAVNLRPTWLRRSGVCACARALAKTGDESAEPEYRKHPACSECGRPWLRWREPLSWIVVGGESGPRARPCDLAWIRSIRDQCRAAGVPVFVKQLGAFPVADGTPAPPDLPPGDFRPCYPGAWADPHFWPEDLRVREWPEVKP